MLHGVGRGHRTIKKSGRRLHDLDVAHRTSMKHITRLQTRVYAVVWEGWKVTIADTIHDKIPHLRRRGVGGRQLRHRAEWIFHQNCINEPRTGSTAEFEVDKVYKEQVAFYHTPFSPLHIKLFYVQVDRRRMNDAVVKVSPWFQELPKEI